MKRRQPLVQKCCATFLAVFLGLWAVSLVSLYIQDQQDDTEFSPEQIFFFYGQISYTDLTDFDAHTARFGATSGSRGLSYPAPMMSGLLLVTRYVSKPVIVYEVFLVLLTLACLVVLLRTLSGSAPLLSLTASLSVLGSFPLMYLMERANIEGLLFAIELTGILAFIARRHLIAGLLIALACSMKLYPGLLLLLLLYRRKYKEFFVSGAAIIVFTVLGYWSMGPTIPQAFSDVQAGMTKEHSDYFVAFRPTEIGFDHSVFALIKTVLYISGFDLAAIKRTMSLLFTPYLLTCVCSLAALYFLRIRRMPLLNQIVLYLSLCVSLPFMSNEYTLVHIHIALALFLVFLARDLTRDADAVSFRAALAFLIPFAIIVAPATYVTWPTNPHGASLKTISLMCLWVAALTVPLRCSLLESPVSS